MVLGLLAYLQEQYVEKNTGTNSVDKISDYGDKELILCFSYQMKNISFAYIKNCFEAM